MIKNRLFTLKKKMFKVLPPSPWGNQLMSLEQANEILNSKREDNTIKKHEYDCLKDSSEEYDLAIIIPAYNVDKYIEACVDSIVNQKTSFSYKVIIINDGSKDNTGQILKKYDSNSQVEVFTWENHGLSASRNLGLSRARGRYVLFVDGDDLMEDNSLQALMDSTKNGADIVEGSYSFFEEDKIIASPKHKDGGNINLNLYGFAWNKIIKASLLYSVAFPIGVIYEDTIFKMIVNGRAEKVNILDECTYLYRRNRGGISFSNQVSEKNIDTLWVTRWCINFIFDNNIEIDKYYLLNALLIQAFTNYKRLWWMSKKERKALFVITRSLFEKLSLEDKENCSNEYLKLYNCIIDNDFKEYDRFMRNKM